MAHISVYERFGVVSMSSRYVFKIEIFEMGINRESQLRIMAVDRRGGREFPLPKWRKINTMAFFLQFECRQIKPDLSILDFRISAILTLIKMHILIS